MGTIKIEYYEVNHNDPYQCTLLGYELCENIDETVIPQLPTESTPIYISKKFTDNNEYRWLVDSIEQSSSSISHQLFKIMLVRKKQLNKEYYLTSIIKTKNQNGGISAVKNVSSILQKYTLVEVEFGHPLRIAKLNGEIKSNKRYPDTVQMGNMPKRRLAIVLAVTNRKFSSTALVVPISSKPPAPNDNKIVDVTHSLSNMVNYQKTSWAVCNIIETVPISRIIAPLVRKTARTEYRDVGFKFKLLPEDREKFEKALFYGIDQGVKYEQIARHQEKIVKLEEDKSTLIADLQQTQAMMVSLKKIAEDYSELMGQTLDEVVESYID